MRRKKYLKKDMGIVKNIFMAIITGYGYFMMIIKH